MTKSYKSIIKRIRLRTWIAFGIIIVLSPILFAAAYGILGALGGSNATPIAHWAFDEGADNTCSGGTNDACDSTGNGNDGAISGATWQTEDKCVSGKCLYFDGTNDTISLPSDMLDGYSTGSVCTWFRWNVGADSGSEYHMFSYADSAGTQNKANFYVSDSSTDDANLIFFLRTSTGNDVTIKTGAQAVARNQWQHTCVTQDGSGLELYLNGNLAQTTTTTNGTGTANDWFATIASGAENASISGTIDDAPGQFFPGFMDEVKVFDTALSSAQVKSEFAGGSAVLGQQDNKDFLSDGLVGYWPMDDNVSGNGQTISDRSGNGNNATTNDGANDTGMDCTSSGKFGGGCEFDGTDDYVQDSPADSIVVGEGESLTASTWFKADTLNSTYRHLINNGWSTTEGFFLRINTSNRIEGKIEDTDGDVNCNDPAGIIGTTTLTTGNWYLATFTWDAKSGESKLYLNGNLEGSCKDTDINNTAYSNLLTFGTHNANSAYFDGIMDEARIYNRALSPAEVQALYNWAPGPVGYWKMDDKVSGNGQTIIDSSGNGNNGTTDDGANNTGMNCNDPGKLGSACDLDGNDDYISVGDVAEAEFGTGDFTLMGWIKHTDPPSASADTIFRNRASGGAGTVNGYAFQVHSGAIRLQIDNSDGGSSISTAGTVATDTWQHVAVSVDRDSSTGTKFYLDGVLVGTADPTAVENSLDNASGLGIGSINGGGTGYFDGNLDDLKIYNYARSPQQIVEDMNGGHPTGGSPVGSHVAYWALDETAGTTANDGSINENALTLSAASWTTSGKFNSAWNGDGTKWLSRADDADFDLAAADEYSVSMWFKSDSATNPGSTEYLFSKGRAAPPGYSVYLNTSGFICFSTDDDATWTPDDTACGTTDVYDGAWHHVVAQKTGTSEIRVYVDGQSVGAKTTLVATGTLANSGLLYIGDDDGDATNSFNGDIDEVKIYRSALTEEQIKIVYNAGSTNNFGTGTSEKADIAGGAGNPPIGYWNFDEQVSGNGETVFDKSGNGNNGTTNDGANDTGMNCGISGKYGTACEFDGADDNISVANSSLLNLGTSDFTLTAWVRGNDMANSDIIFGKSTGGGCSSSYGFLFGVFDSVYPTLYFCSTTGTHAKVQGTTSLSNDQWYHLAISIDRSSDANTIVYINGIPATTTVANLSSHTGSISNTEALVFGSESDGGFNWDGLIDDAKIFDYALSQAQVAYEYNRGAPIGWWQFDECTGATANDAMGVAGNGTITPGASGNTTVGTCGSGTSTHMWNDGTTGKINGSLGFDGTDDYVIVSSPTLPTGDFTIALWFKGATVGNETLFHVPNSGNGNELQIKSASQVQLFTNGSQTVTGSSTLSAGTWYHLAATRSGSNLTVYVNGKSDGTGTDGTAFDFSTCAIYIGSDFGCGSTQANPAEGQIDDVRLYNYALTAEQIQKVMLGGSASGSGVSFGPSQGSP